MTNCGIKDYQALLDGINKDKDYIATAALTDEETCLISDHGNWNVLYNLSKCFYWIHSVYGRWSLQEGVEENILLTSKSVS